MRSRAVGTSLPQRRRPTGRPAGIGAPDLAPMHRRGSGLRCGRVCDQGAGDGRRAEQELPGREFRLHVGGCEPGQIARNSLTPEDVAGIELRRLEGALDGAFDLAPAGYVSLSEFEHAYIRQVIAAADGNMSRAARILGIDRPTLYRKLAGEP